MKPSDVIKRRFAQTRFYGANGVSPSPVHTFPWMKPEEAAMLSAILEFIDEMFKHVVFENTEEKLQLGPADERKQI